MIITFYNPAAIKAQVGDKSLVFSPGDRNIYRSKPSRFSTDVFLTSLNDSFSAIKRKDLSEDQSLIEGPGEYELSGIFIKAFASSGPKELINTIYVVDFDGIRLGYLGALANIDISDETAEEIGSTDIIFIPIGGQGTLSPAQAAKLTANIQPKIVVPIFPDDEGKNLSLFKKEIGGDGGEVMDKLSVKKKDLEGKESEVVILSAV